MQDLACPNCHQADRVQKVSAVVTGGVSTGMYSGPTGGVGYTFGERGGASVIGGHTTLSGGSWTVLSQRLAPPSKPHYQPSSGCAWAFVTVLPFSAGGLVGVVLSSQSSLRVLAALFVVLGFVGTILVDRYLLKVEDVRKQRVADQLPLWEKASSRWNQLFYCYRCDAVFLPGLARAVPPERMRDLLYEQQAFHPTSPRHPRSSPGDDQGWPVIY